MHPAVSPDGSRLFFASNMPGTFGEYDIYVATIQKNGTLGQAKNLGEKVNTAKNDMHPNPISNGSLVFASDGRDGYGGLDVYMVEVGQRSVGLAVNMGNTINSSYDEYSVNLLQGDGSGYVVSNRIAKGKHAQNVAFNLNDKPINEKDRDDRFLEAFNSETRDVYVSAPVIREGEYFAGVYTSPRNEKVFKINQLSDFSQLTAVSTPRWQTDWQTLSALPLKELLREDEWLSQVRMVSMQWVDFVMMPLMPSLNNRYILEDINLVAVPDVLLQLNDSRHFIISKKHPDGKAAYTALQKGLQQLREAGAIEKAYREAGFIPDLTHYTVINKQP